ncbi:tol-pal system protein YbgF [Paroceanicella profunda]|uniref:Cell division coordinator CpoB n=1 Tax=Paroceanicella profunda TaxID=2579971 RepID=A0A5B8FZI2_9RHOB|nr:tol-pal system protein YbgF [Paroceanicella profunda]QDL92072.1 tol-pal system protein YbgF [Paroceanicella profunda]
MRIRLTALVISLVLPVCGMAQTAPSAQSLEDIRQNLQAIDSEVAQLRTQLLATGNQLPATAGNPLQRLDALEHNTRLLTGRVEQLQNDIRRMADDAGRRYSDVDFRLTEIEGGDTALLGNPVALGGGVTDGTAGSGGGTGFGGPMTAGQSDTPNVAVAISEQNSYDAADAALEAGRYEEAAAGFRAFLGEYPDSPLANDATFELAQANLATGAFRDAAKGYLKAFNAEPNGPNAPEALYGVGISLQYLGQMPEACLTYDEVERRFPAMEPDLADKLEQGRDGASCQR